MKQLTALLTAGCFVLGCQGEPPTARASERPIENANANADMSFDTDEAVVRFSDILAQYQDINARLETVAARLQTANAALCPAVTRDPGYTVHTLSDYPMQLQQVARALLPVDEGLSVRTVRDGGPAQRAGVKAGDKLVGINGQRFPGGLTQRKFYDRAAGSAFAAPSARLTIARQTQVSGQERDRKTSEVMSFKIAPKTICGYPAHVVFDESINGHTDGRAIWITSELMRTVGDDVNLALIVAHEMAHAIDGDIDKPQSKRLELKADSMALVMLARAGFDMDRAIAYWSRADNPQRMAQSRSGTHPSITQRLSNFEVTRQAIAGAQRRGETLDFSLIPKPAL